jgi:hypothetical protein
VVETLLSVDHAVPHSKGMSIRKLANGEYLSSQLLSYQWVADFGNPYIYWTKTRLRKINPETVEFYGPVVEHFTNNEMYNAGPYKCLPTGDGGGDFCWL